MQVGSRSQWSQYEGVVEAQQHPVGSDTSRPSGQVEETLPILKASTPNHPHPALWRVALTPTSRLKSRIPTPHPLSFVKSLFAGCFFQDPRICEVTGI